MTDRPVSGIVQEVLRNLQDILRSEIRLAKAELKEDAQQAAAAAKTWGIAAWMLLFASAFLLVAVMRAMERAIPDWQGSWPAPALLGTVLAIIGIALWQSGRAAVRNITIGPEKTIESLRKDLKAIRR